MDYKKEYERLTKFIKDLYPFMSEYCKEKIEGMFPKLKESEDEVMRAMAIKAVHAPEAQSCIKSWGINPDDVITWLENKPTNDEMIRILRTEYEKGRADTIAEMQKSADNIKLYTFKDKLLELFQKFRWKCKNKTLTNGDILDYVDSHIQELIDTVQNKSIWSEEDEIGFNDVLWAIEQARTVAKDEDDMGDLWYAEKWLKSIKERVQLQPKA